MSLSVWNKLEEMRRGIEGDPFWGAILGGGIALIIEAGRLINAQSEATADKQKQLEDKLNVLGKKADGITPNVHRQAGKKPAVSNVATTLTTGGSTVSEISGITNTDQSGKLRITASTVATPAAATLFRMNFATRYAQTPAVFVQQQAGADIGLRVANVSDSGFDVVTAAGITINTAQELVYFVVPLALSEALG